MVKSKLLRVTQINAVYFDKEILNMFKQQINDCLKYFPPDVAVRYEAEVNLLLRLAVLRYSILNHDCSFGQKLLSIKYDNLGSRHKLCFIIADCFTYVKEKLELASPSHYMNRCFRTISLCVQLLRFWNISLFLRYGLKPRIIERFLGLEQTYTKENSPRHYEDKYMTRELIWNGFIEVLVYTVPLINYHKITRTLRHLSPLHKKPSAMSQHRELTHDTRCPHCEEYPLLPCHMGCSHIFCYSCLKGNQTADPRFECPICEYRSQNVMCDKVFIS